MNWLCSHGIQVTYMPCSSNMVRLGMIYGDVFINKTNYYSIALVRYKIVNGKRGTTHLVGYIYYDDILCMLIK